MGSRQRGRIGLIGYHGARTAIREDRDHRPNCKSRLRAVLVSLRPRQWVKNLFVLAGLVFAQKLLTPLVWPALAAFALFCALSGAVYLFNDVADRAQDRLHPQKRLRPVAAGTLGTGPALGIATGLFVGSLALGFVLSRGFGVVALAYAVLLVAYSAWLKHVVIVDVLVVAIGFVLRAVAGALAVVTASTVTAYALYTMSPETVGKFHTQLLPATLPFVLYGIFRYLYLLYRRQLGGNPSELFLNDRALLANTLLWMLAVLLIIYGPAIAARVGV